MRPITAPTTATVRRITPYDDQPTQRMIRRSCREKGSLDESLKDHFEDLLDSWRLGVSEFVFKMSTHRVDYSISRCSTGKEAGGRKQEADGRKQQAGGRKQEAGGRRQKSVIRHGSYVISGPGSRSWVSGL